MNNRFKQIRKALNMTQEDFGKALERTKRSIIFYEKGERSIDIPIITLLKEKFNVNAEWLIFGTGNMFNNVQNISFNGELLELVVETVEEIFISNQLSLNPNKKAKLIRLLYEYMDKQVIEDGNDGKIIKLQDYFNTKYKNYIINMVSSL